MFLKKIECWGSFCQLLLNKKGTCTPQGWSCWGRWICPGASCVTWDDFKFICLRKKNKWPCAMFIFDEKTGTCCTPHGCTCRVRWGCPKAFWSPLDPSRWLSFEKLFQKHIQLIIFHPKDYLLILHFEVEGVKGRLGIWLAACKVSLA